MRLKTLLFAAALALCLSACKSPTALTARATGCTVTELEIIDSEYKRAGSTTAWCARCKGTNYTCVTNTARDVVECREAAAASPCG
jgi:hypothetical protein